MSVCDLLAAGQTGSAGLTGSGGPTRFDGLTRFEGLTPFAATAPPACLGRQVGAGWLRFGATPRPYRILSPDRGGQVWLVDDPVALIEVYPPEAPPATPLIMSLTHTPSSAVRPPERFEVPLAVRLQRSFLADGVTEIVYAARGLALCLTEDERLLRIRGFESTDAESYVRDWLTLPGVRFLE